MSDSNNQKDMENKKNEENIEEKEIKSIPSNITSDSTSNPPVRRRGRPKSKITAKRSYSNTDQDTEQKPPPRKRGRPSNAQRAAMQQANDTISDEALALKFNANEPVDDHGTPHYIRCLTFQRAEEEGLDVFYQPSDKIKERDRFLQLYHLIEPLTHQIIPGLGLTVGERVCTMKAKVRNKKKDQKGSKKACNNNK